MSLWLEWPGCPVVGVSPPPTPFWLWACPEYVVVVGNIDSCLYCACPVPNIPSSNRVESTRKRSEGRVEGDRDSLCPLDLFLKQSWHLVAECVLAECLSVRQVNAVFQECSKSVAPLLSFEFDLLNDVASGIESHHAVTECSPLCQLCQ